MEELYLSIVRVIFIATAILICLMIFEAIIKSLLNPLIMLKRSNLKLSLRPKGMVFGKISRIKVYSPTTSEGHCIVFGGSGEGKTTALLIPTLKAWQGTSFVIDISGDISENIEGTNRVIFEPEGEESLPYNIFGAIDSLTSSEAQNEALLQLALLILPPLTDRADDAARYFNEYGRRFIEAALLAFYPNKKMDFVAICELIVSNDYLHFFDLIEETGNKQAIMRVASMFGGNEKNNSGCKAAADDAVILFATNEKIKRNLRRSKENEYEITPATLETLSVYIKIDNTKLQLFSSLMQIIIGQSLDFFSKRENYTSPSILFCLDEFAALGKLPILNSVRTLRKKAVRIFVLTQSLADIDLTYGKDERKVILDNMRFKVVLSASEVETQKYFSDLIGPKKGRVKAIRNRQKIKMIIKNRQYCRLNSAG